MVDAPVTVSGDFTVETGGRVTVDASSPDAGPLSLKVEVAGTLKVQAGAAIETDAKGLLGSPANGRVYSGLSLEPVTFAVVTAPEGEPGSHATTGQPADLGQAVAPSYGDAFEPSFPGGGGGGYPGSIGGAGGGVVLITAGTFVLDGAVRANGSNGSGYRGGGGAGGSINVTVSGVFSGGGSLSANGGVPGGGAGRVKVTAASWSFAGACNVQQSGVQAGTCHWYDTTLKQVWVAAPLTFRGGEAYDSVQFVPGGSLTIDGKATVKAPLAIPAGTSVTLTNAHALEGLRFTTVDGSLTVKVALSQSTDLLVSGQLNVDAPFTVPNLTLTAGALVTHSRQVTTMLLTVPGTLTVPAGAQISATARGLLGGVRAGFGYYGATLDPTSGALIAGSDVGNGGSHAGLGGKVSPSLQLAATYDTSTSPLFPGGGGGGYRQQYVGDLAGGTGGGVVRIVAGVLALDGTLAADGEGGQYCPDATPPGGGAGGSIVVTTGSVTGTGSIFARGGTAGGVLGAGGGGGLVRLTVGQLSPSILVSVAGGTGLFAGGAGVQTQGASTSAAKIVSVPPARLKAGSTLSYQAFATGAGAVTWSLLSGPPAATVSATGVVSWVSASAGPQAFSLQAATAAGTDVQTFTVDVVSPPTIVSVPNTSAKAGLDYQYDADDRAEATGSGPLSWSTTLSPAGFTVDAQTGQVRWTPPGLGSFSACLVTSNSVGSAQQCFVIEVSAGVPVSTDAGVGVMVAPRLTSMASTTALCGAAYHYSGNKVPEVQGTGPFAFSVTGIPGSPVPEGLTVDAATGEFEWVPSPQQKGAHPLLLSVTNAAGYDQQLFSVVVDCADAPVMPVGCGCSTSASASWWLALVLAAFASRRRNS